MLRLPENIELKFFEMMAGEIELSEFENWVYANEDLKSAMEIEDYYKLASFDYRQGGAKHELLKIIENNYITVGNFERWKVLNLLYDALKVGDNLPQLFRQFDRLCSDGYHFLDNLGYYLNSARGHPLYASNYFPKNIEFQKDWRKLSSDKKKKVISQYYPNLTTDLKRIISWIETDKIVFLGPASEFGCFDYEDHTTQQDRERRINPAITLNPQIDSDNRPNDSTVNKIVNKITDLFSI